MGTSPWRVWKARQADSSAWGFRTIRLGEQFARYGSECLLRYSHNSGACSLDSTLAARLFCIAHREAELSACRMINASFLNIISDRRCWLFLIVALLAVVVSFHSIPDSTALTLVSKAGYWFVLVTFLLWLRSLWQVFAPDIKRLP